FIIHGRAGVLWQPGEQLMIHDIVGPQHLQSAVRLNSTSRQLGILFGPAVGGGLMLWLGPSAGLFINALIYLPLTIYLMVTPYTRHSREGAAPARRAIRWGDAISGIREVAHNRPIITMVILGGCASFFVGSAFQSQMPEFAHDLGAEKADWPTARCWEPMLAVPFSAASCSKAGAGSDRQFEPRLSPQ